MGSGFWFFFNNPLEIVVTIVVFFISYKINLPQLPNKNFEYLNKNNLRAIESNQTQTKSEIDSTLERLELNNVRFMHHGHLHLCESGHTHEDT